MIKSQPILPLLKIILVLFLYKVLHVFLMIYFIMYIAYFYEECTKGRHKLNGENHVDTISAESSLGSNLFGQFG